MILRIIRVWGYIFSVTIVYKKPAEIVLVIMALGTFIANASNYQFR